jgi:hypothetical protein
LGGSASAAGTSVLSGARQRREKNPGFFAGWAGSVAGGSAFGRWAESAFALGGPSFSAGAVAAWRGAPLERRMARDDPVSSPLAGFPGEASSGGTARARPAAASEAASAVLTQMHEERPCVFMSEFRSGGAILRNSRAKLKSVFLY